MTKTNDVDRAPAHAIVMRRAERFGVGKPACKNCHVGGHETDGDYGEIDCGWWCGAKDDETEPDAICDLWLPDFWETPFADEVGGETPEDVNHSMVEASKRYKAAIKSA